MAIVALVLLGLCFGSFVNALVWRVHKRRDMVRERSECTHCHHVLAWYDLIPVLSWAMLRGKCRYCHKPIDDTPLVELAVALLWAISYLVWPYTLMSSAQWALFGLWLVALVALVALADYDIRWGLLPDVMVWPLAAVGAAIGWLRFAVVERQSLDGALLTMGTGVLVIAGLYGALYYFSRGRYVGFGDVKLNIFIGLVTGWQGALVALMAANLLGTLWVVPGLVTRRLTRSSRVPFGPFLIIGCIIAVLWGNQLIQWYIRSFLPL